MLQIKNLSYRYPGAGATSALLLAPAFSLVKGQHAVLLGPSGCGKSTLLHLMAAAKLLLLLLVERLLLALSADQHVSISDGAVTPDEGWLALVAAHAKDEEICHAELAKAGKGLAIGKLCGIKHQH